MNVNPEYIYLIYTSIRLPIYPSLSIYFSIYLFFYLSISLSIYHLSEYQCMNVNPEYSSKTDDISTDQEGWEGEGGGQERKGGGSREGGRVKGRGGVEGEETSHCISSRCQKKIDLLEDTSELLCAQHDQKKSFNISYLHVIFKKETLK